jgi:hypothetical protein
MGHSTRRRIRQLNRKGRDMVLAHPGNTDSVTVRGYLPPPDAAQITSEVARVSIVVEIGIAELAAKPGFGDPKPTDKLRDGKRTYTLTDAVPVYDGDTLSGWTLIAAGGR